MSTEAAFRQLDPILRMLLQSLQNYRQACTSNQPNEERLVGILQVQVSILERLKHALQQVVEMYGSGVLQAQLEYILLPLKLILQSSEWTADEGQQVARVRQSALWKSIESAAKVMENTIKLAGSGVSVKQSLECIRACTFPLPTDKMEDGGGLDRGDDCTCAVLQCLNTILDSVHNTHADFSQALDPNLVARLAFSCTSLLSLDDRKKRHQVQIQALQTLDTLMNVVTNPEVWQSFFPGVFATLFGLILSELRLAPAQASPKVSSGACHTLSKLLIVALATSEKTQTSNDNPLNAWKHVQQLAAESSSASETSRDSSDTNPFLKEVHTRLPGPLILLLNLFPTASSPTLRRSAPELCHAILVETRNVWEQQQEDETPCNVMQTAIECCIAQSRDKDERVASAARNTMADYRQGSGRHDIDNSIGPRVLQLIQDLPALARSGRETELRGRINVISGYLLLLGDSLRSSLSSVANEIRTSMAGLFDVDFDSIQYAPRVETTDSWDVWQPDRCRFRFMMDDTARSAREMVVALGTTLGQKGASSFVDDCIADVLEACVATTHNKSGPRQVDWLHQWIGYIIVAKALLVGAFEGPVEAGSGPNGEDLGETSSRQARKRRRRLKSLAGAILPVVTSAPLWTLPTVLDNVDQTTSKRDQSPSLTITEVHETSNVQAQQNVSASALKGNAAMVCSLIAIVGETCDLLGNDVEPFLQVILYPLCERASSQNHSQVQRTACLTLQQVAMSCDMKSTKELIRQNFDYLFGAMLSRTRRQGKQHTGHQISFPSSIPSIVKVVLRSATETDTASGICSERSLSDETNVSYVIDLVNALVVSFDNNLRIMNEDPSLQVSTCLDLVEVFDAALSFLASTFGLSLDKRYDPFAGITAPENGVDWKATLDPFRLLKPDGLTAQEGFEKMRTDAQRDNDSNDGDAPVMRITNGEVELVDLVLARCSFFLSSPSLQIEMASCDGMKYAFTLLGYVAKYTKPNEDEPNGPKNAVFRHISSSWPSILSRLRALSSQLCTAASGQVVSLRSLDVVASSKTQDVSTETIYLAKLFELIASMCEVSDDFMVDRLKQQVWPVTASLLDMYVQEEKRNTRKQLGTDSLVLKDAKTSKWPVTERERLLFSMLEFLTRIYSQRQCGRGLSDLIPSAGTIVLPFLAKEGELQARTMQTLKAMLLIDCDALWRPLLNLGHQQIPPCLFGARESPVAIITKGRCDSMTPLESAAKDLMEFVESLPEQPLDINC